jgi:hypothetical protein
MTDVRALEQLCQERETFDQAKAHGRTFVRGLPFAE